jgi:hypothetical protein
VYAELDDKITAPRKALQRLTSLQELILHKGDANVLLQATSKLLQLRSLNAKQLSAAGVGAFKHLPPQLQSCTFTADLSGAASGVSADEVGAEKHTSQQQQQQLMKLQHNELMVSAFGVYADAVNALVTHPAAATHGAAVVTVAATTCLSRGEYLSNRANDLPAT